MTYEEAIEAIKEAYGNTEYTNEIIKALEQEPCKDVISRQAAIDSIQYAGKIGKQTCISILKRLPSAQPERKKGRWICLDDFCGKYNENGFTCSECNEHSDYEENFCPNCGADMRGEQE